MSLLPVGASPCLCHLGTRSPRPSGGSPDLPAVASLWCAWGKRGKKPWQSPGGARVICQQAPAGCACSSQHPHNGAAPERFPKPTQLHQSLRVASAGSLLRDEAGAWPELPGTGSSLFFSSPRSLAAKPEAEVTGAARLQDHEPFPVALFPRRSIAVFRLDWIHFPDRLEEFEERM
jgi:hypothetical protein